MGIPINLPDRLLSAAKTAHSLIPSNPQIFYGFCLTKPTDTQALELVPFDNTLLAEPAAPANAASRETVAGVCGVCPAGCGVNIHLVDGRIERLTPLRDHPLGFVCPRGAQAAEVV
ncbi:MAG: hypothetical protein IMF05_07415, partial [Proteobacteria bacterium]|nr:hypothetical protein [Pseudomonadota bacterium]